MKFQTVFVLTTMAAALGTGCSGSDTDFGDGAQSAAGELAEGQADMGADSDGVQSFEAAAAGEFVPFQGEEETELTEDEEAELALVEESPRSEPVEVTSDGVEVGTLTQALLGSNACKDTTLYVWNGLKVNGQPVDIRIRYFKYWDATSAKWRKEDVSNADASYKSAKYWSWQDLEYTKDHYINDWRVYFSYRLPGASWSNTVYMQVIPYEHYGEKCKQYNEYKMDVL